MTTSAIVYTRNSDSLLAAGELANRIADAMAGSPPDALIVFASPTYDHAAFLGELVRTTRTPILVGASSAGEFTRTMRGDGMACALALRSENMKFAAGVGRGLAANRAGCARSIAASFHGASPEAAAYPHRAALVLTDALAGHADDLVDELTLATQGGWKFFGGGAGDNAQFKSTPVFFHAEAIADGAVALEILSKRPIGIGVGHGWEPASAPMRVTEAKGLKLVSLNGVTAVHAFLKHAEVTRQTLNLQNPIPFFLHNILGVETGGAHRLRVPLSIGADGSISCAAEIPTGAIVHIMKTTSTSAADAAARATRAAVEGLEGNKPQVALFFDCVATRLRLGDMFGLELQAVADNLGDASFVGCNTHGQIARAGGQFGGFHNCTAVVCALPV